MAARAIEDVVHLLDLRRGEADALSDAGVVPPSAWRHLQIGGGTARPAIATALLRRAAWALSGAGAPLAWTAGRRRALRRKRRRWWWAALRRKRRRWWW